MGGNELTWRVVAWYNVGEGAETRDETRGQIDSDGVYGVADDERGGFQGVCEQDAEERGQERGLCERGVLG